MFGETGVFCDGFLAGMAADGTLNPRLTRAAAALSAARRVAAGRKRSAPKWKPGPCLPKS
jgi:TfoX/Sxy family transcriptional regulator of competence genes